MLSNYSSALIDAALSLRRCLIPILISLNQFRAKICLLESFFFAIVCPNMPLLDSRLHFFHFLGILDEHLFH